jgi:hypothetical protein
MVHGVQKSMGGKDLPAEATAGVLPENLQFVRENEPEITQLMEKLKALEKKKP